MAISIGGAVGFPLADQQKGKSWVDRDREVIWHPYTSLRESELPLVITRAKGEFLWTEQGDRYIDGICSWWTTLFGHRDPLLMQAWQEASEQIDHVIFAGATHPWAIALAEAMIRTAFNSGGKVFYSDNGSTAVEVALKMAFQYHHLRGEHQRAKYICFAGGYHGDTIGAMSVGRDDLFFGCFEPIMFKVLQIPFRLDAIQTLESAKEIDCCDKIGSAGSADLKMGSEALNCLEEICARESANVAAIILEPLVQGAGGMRIYSPAILEQIAKIARKYDLLLIADEVMTSCRTGTLWAHQQARIAPDFICAGKTISGGMVPLSATLVSPKVVEVFNQEDRRKTFFHGHSFTAHPLACAVGLKNWQRLTAQIESDPHQRIPDVTRIQQFWQKAIEHYGWQRTELPIRIRTCGSIIAIEFLASNSSNDSGYLAKCASQFRRLALDNHVFLRPLGNVLYSMPPLGITESSLEQIAHVLNLACQAYLHSSR